MTKKDKIQYLLITYLLKEGEIELALPDGMTLKLGVTAETKKGVEKRDDYCWLEVEQDGRQVCLDARSLGLQFSRNRMMFQNKEDDICSVDVV